MQTFSAEEIATLDGIWRALPEDHVWCGWASVGDPPEEISIFRTRAHWRRFRLLKRHPGYVILNEEARVVAASASLPGLLKEVEGIPGLRTMYLPEDPTIRRGEDPR